MQHIPENRNDNVPFRKRRVKLPDIIDIDDQSSTFRVDHSLYSRPVLGGDSLQKTRRKRKRELVNPKRRRAEKEYTPCLMLRHR